VNQVSDRYIIVRNEALEILVSTVNALIKDGYLPQGGISVASYVMGKDNDVYNFEYSQAMIKGETD